MKVHATTAPFGEFGVDVFGEKDNPGVAPDEFVCAGLRRRQGQSEVCAAIRRRNFDPAATRLECVIDYDAETKLVHVETQAPFLIADENHDEVQREIGLLPVEAEKGPLKTEGYGSVGHPRDYEVGRASGHLAFQ